MVIRSFQLFQMGETMTNEQKTSSISTSDFYKPSAGQWMILIIALLICLAFALKEIMDNRHSLKEMGQESEAWQALANHAVQQLTRRCVREQKLYPENRPESSTYMDCDGLTITFSSTFDRATLFLVHDQTRYPGYWNVRYNIMWSQYDVSTYHGDASVSSDDH